MTPLSHEREVSQEQEFMTWLLEDLSNERPQDSLYFVENTKGFPWPSIIEEEDRYSAVVEAAAEYGEGLREAALQYWERETEVMALESLLGHLDRYRLLPAEDDSWLEDLRGTRCTVSRPGFNHDGDVAVVYADWRAGLGGGWGEIRGYEKTAEGWQRAYPDYLPNWVACGLIKRSSQ